MKKLLGPLYDTLFAYADVCELRLAVGCPILVRSAGRVISTQVVCTQPMLDEVLAVATEYSLYTAVSRMVAGYLPYRGGVRIGLAGRYALKDGVLHSLQQPTGMVIRLPHAVGGASDVLPLKRVLGRNVLIVAPPFGGKTTFLRDLAGRLSKCAQVVVIDEREELAGAGQLSVGNCMVVAGAPKHLAFEGIVRALSPQYVVCDELSVPVDLGALAGLAASGVHVVATLHGNSLSLADKSLMAMFDVRVLLSAVPRAGHVVEVMYD